MKPFIKDIIIFAFILLTINVHGQFSELKYNSGMKKHMANHKFINDSILNSLKINQTDSTALYFPFFFKLNEREAQQANYFGILYLTDSLIIFKHTTKKSNKVLPNLTPFIIRINSIIEYELFENSNSFSIKTSNDMQYLFLSEFKKKFYSELKKTLERNNIARKESLKK